VVSGDLINLLPCQRPEGTLAGESRSSRPRAGAEAVVLPAWDGSKTALARSKSGFGRRKSGDLALLGLYSRFRNRHWQSPVPQKSFPNRPGLNRPRCVSPHLTRTNPAHARVLGFGWIGSRRTCVEGPSVSLVRWSLSAAPGCGMRSSGRRGDSPRCSGTTYTHTEHLSERERGRERVYGDGKVANRDTN
jgi:hypothetical protein